MPYKLRYTVYWTFPAMRLARHGWWERSFYSKVVINRYRERLIARWPDAVVSAVEAKLAITSPNH